MSINLDVTIITTKTVMMSMVIKIIMIIIIKIKIIIILIIDIMKRMFLMLTIRGNHQPCINSLFFYLDHKSSFFLFFFKVIQFNSK